MKGKNNVEQKEKKKSRKKDTNKNVGVIRTQNNWWKKTKEERG
jgi:hypothetical protein